MTDNKDLNRRFDNLEKRLDALVVDCSLSSFHGSSSRSDEIDLREIFAILWQGKWLLMGVTSVFAVISLIFALNLPSVYEGRGVYAPAQKQNSGSLGGQLGGLASLAGVNLASGENNDINQAMVLVRSWPFLSSFIKKYDLKPFIMAVDGWDFEKNEIVWNEELYDPATGQWILDTNGKQTEPSSFEAYKKFSNMLSVSKDTKTSLITIGIEYYVPGLSASWVNMIVQEINDHFKKRDKLSAVNKIEYLNLKIADTGIAEMHTVLYSMIEAQTKILMLAEVSDEYLIETVVPVKIPEEASGPNRLVILIVGSVLGCVFSIVVLIFIYISKKEM